MRKFVLLLLLVTTNTLVNYAQTGYITTFAGTGALGYSGDGGPAVEARLNAPIGVIADAAGNIYISDFGTNVIRKVSSTGIISTVAGNGTSGYMGDGGPATAAGLQEPEGMAVDATGNLYIADDRNNVIRKVTPAGIITTIAGNGYGSGIPAFCNGGYNGDGIAATAAELNNPEFIAIDAAGNIYFSDHCNSIVRKVDNAGIITTFAGMYDSIGFSGDGGPANLAKLSRVDGLALDASGNLYIADQGNNVIRKVTTSGTISTFAGMHDSSGYSGDGGPAISAKLFAYGLAFDNIGNLYFSQSSVIRKVDAAGIVTTMAGKYNTGFSGSFGGDLGPATAALFNEATGIACDAAGNLYIADTYNARIRKVSSVNPLTLGVVPMSAPTANIQLYPNPNKGTFLVRGSLNQKNDPQVNVQVSDILGRLVYSGATTAQQGDIAFQIQLDNIPVGVYFLKLLTNHEETYNFRFVIEQ
jgi:hypothetical protein